MLSQQQQSQAHSPSQPGQVKQCQQGEVTKILDNFGFIDDSVFFPFSAVRGPSVKVGDKVYYECTYSKNLPFNWNATLVQLVQPGGGGGPSSSSGGGGVGVGAGSSAPQANPNQVQQPHSTSTGQVTSGNPSSSSHSNSSSSKPLGGSYASPANNFHHHQPHHHQGPPLPQQQQQPPPGFAHYPPTQPPNIGTKPNSFYQQQQKPPPPQPHPQQPKPYGSQPGPYPGPYGPQGGVGGDQGPPPQQQRQSLPTSQPGSAQQQPPPAQPPPPTQAQVPFADYQKVQQAVAQLQQYYGGNQGPGGGGGGGVGGGPPPPQQQQPGGPPPQQQHGPPHQQGPPPNHQPGGPPSGPYGQLQYTSTPGAPFMQGPPPPHPYQGGGGPPPPPGKHGPPGPRGPPPQRWDNRGPPPPDDPRGFDPRRGPPPPRDDHHRGPPQRFGGPPPGASRFDDRGPPPPSRFGGPPPGHKDDRFERDFRGGGGGGGRDEFGRDLRKEDRFDRRDKDPRDGYRGGPGGDRGGGGGGGDRGGGPREKEDREPPKGRGSRERDGRRYQKKRSISPVGSVTSSSGGGRDSGRSIPVAALPSKKRFEGCNIPKASVLKNRYTTSELKSKLGSSIHVPSDLKEVVYGADLNFDLLDIPKPIQYKITNEKEVKDFKDKDGNSKDKEGGKEVAKKRDESEKDTSAVSTNKNKINESEKDEKEKPTGDGSAQEPENKSDGVCEEVKPEVSSEEKQPEVVESKAEESMNDSATMYMDESSMLSQQSMDSQPEVPKSTAASSGSATKEEAGKEQVNHKFNVKVLFIALPTLADIYERLFGPDFDGSDRKDSKSSVNHFNKLLNLVVQRNSNDGYSLIGGKWQKEVDGYLPGTTDPNLVQTAIRVVYENTGLNLTTCRRWKVISTFIYSRNDLSADRKNSNYEITKVYFPDLWSAYDSIYTPLSVCSKEPEPTITTTTTTTTITSKSTSTCALKQESVEQETLSFSMEVDESIKSKDDNEDVSSLLKRDELNGILANLADMKVADLKAKLEELGLHVEGRPRKDQLAQRLREFISAELEKLDDGGNGETEDSATVVEENDTEVKPEVSAGVVEVETVEDKPSEEEEAEGLKRKLDEEVDGESSTATKKAKPSEEEGSVVFSPSAIRVKGHRLTMVSLYNALSPHRFDQFELVVSAELLKDSLVAHFARYIYSAVLYNQQMAKLSSAASTATTSTSEKRTIPVNYVHLAFSYFDKARSGYINADDLYNLLNVTGFNLSRKTFNTLVTSDRLTYRDYLQPPLLAERISTYPTVDLGTSGTATLAVSGASSGGGSGGLLPLIVERNSTQYNVDELIKQSELDQKLKVRLNEELLGANNKIVQLENSVAELEQKQKKMSAATARQNDELCAVKRERDQFKVKFDQIRKMIEKTMSGFGELLKQTPITATAAVAASETNGSASSEPSSSTNNSTD